MVCGAPRRPGHYRVEIPSMSDGCGAVTEDLGGIAAKLSEFRRSGRICGMGVRLG